MRTPRASSPWMAYALVSAGLLFPCRASAWSANGHKTVALIAESRLSETSKAAIAAILGPTATLDAIAPCADDIRGKSGFDCAGLQLAADPQSQPWHFVDAPITASPAAAPDLEAFCPGGACVVDQIRAALKTLQDSSPTLAANDKQVALMFLVHFVGDVHQPLHCANEIVNGVNDRGGNLKKVAYNGVASPGGFALNLHALWDHQINSSDTNDPAATSRRLIADLQNKDVSSWLAGDFVGGAALESFAIAKGTVYPAYYAQNPMALGADYQRQMQPIVDERLERAGVRLAALLEQAFAPQSPAAVAGRAAALATPPPAAIKSASFDGARK
ncbi:MAG: S1/P1 nuclease [Elusimicrobiota bacterium]